MSPLRRQIHPMPDFVAEALETRNLSSAFQARPAYQRNDYLGWILRARQPATSRKRLAQMLDELEQGGVYMGMDHPPSVRK